MIRCRGWFLKRLLLTVSLHGVSCVCVKRESSLAWGDAQEVLPHLFHMAIRGFLLHRVASVSWLCSRALREVFSSEDSRYVVVLGSGTPSCCHHLHCSLP